MAVDQSEVEYFFKAASRLRVMQRLRDAGVPAISLEEDFDEIEGLSVVTDHPLLLRRCQGILGLRGEARDADFTREPFYDDGALA